MTGIPVKRWIRDALPPRFRQRLRRIIGHRVCFNVNHALDPKAGKRALLVYLTKAFRVDEGDPAYYSHQAFRQCRQIAALLGESGYVVDVADFDDEVLKTPYQYDFILSHNVNLPRVRALSRPGAVCVYLASGMNHRVYNERFGSRLERIREQRGCDICDCRPNDERMSFLREAQAVIGFGNEFTTGTWRQDFSGPVHAFDNYGFACPGEITRNEAEARLHFLYFGSQNQVIKGLHLLLEVFKECPDLHLHVAGLYESEKDFCQCYKHELFGTANIHPLGWVQVGSARWREIAGKCAFAVLPACSEGQSGSVVQCMYAGLIPIVTRETGVDVEGFGFFAGDDSIQTLRDLIRQAARLPAAELKSRSVGTLAAARTRYSEDAFMARWREILHQVVSR